MKRAEAFAGAPVVRGVWAAVAGFTVGGLAWGDMDLGIVWWAVPDAAHIGHTHWGIDAALAVFGGLAWGWGLLNFHRALRNAWFTWAKDDEPFNGVKRCDVNREPTKLMRWLYRGLGG